MSRRDLLASLASAASTPWAMREETLRDLTSSLTGGGFASLERLDLGGIALGSEITEPVGITFSRETVETGEEDGFVTREGGPAAARLSPATERAIARRPGGVAVIPVKGVISSRVSMWDLLFGGGATPPAWIARQRQRAMDDDSIKAIVMQYDTPGGSVFGVEEAAEAMAVDKGKKPVIAHVTGSCASAGYWLASGADEIVADPTSIIGSIGVYMVHEDLSKLYEELGVKVTYIKAGQYKVEGNETEPLTVTAEEHLQEMVDDYMKLFVDQVAKGRNVATSLVRGERFGQGRAYVAARSQERGLIDRVRSFDDTLRALGMDPNAPEPETRARGRGLALLGAEIATLG